MRLARSILGAEDVWFDKDEGIEARLEVSSKETMHCIRHVIQLPRLDVTHARRLDDALDELLPVERLLAVEPLVGGLPSGGVNGNVQPVKVGNLTRF